MSEITKEYLDQKFAELPQRKELDILTRKFDGLTQELSEFKEEIVNKIDNVETSLETSTGDLARITADSFEEIKAKLDVKKEVEILNKRMGKLEQALNIHQ